MLPRLGDCESGRRIGRVGLGLISQPVAWRAEVGFGESGGVSG